MFNKDDDPRPEELNNRAAIKGILGKTNPDDRKESDGAFEETEINQEEMINKIKHIPIEKLKQIITDQIDLEIRLKHKELTLTEEEIGKCESQMITLRNLFKIPREKSIDNEPNDFTIKYYDLLNRSLSVSYDSNEFKEMISNLSNLSNNRESVGSIDSNFNSIIIHENGSYNGFGDVGSGGGHTYRTRSTTSALRPSTNSLTSRAQTNGCLYRRTDGIIVKLTCPDCKRSNFSSAQGFLNHSRIAHTQEYTSQDAAALICGEILPDNEQDEEGLSSIKNLKSKKLDPSKNLNINEIYFNGLSNTLNTVHKSNLEKSLSPLDKTEEEIKVVKNQEKNNENSELMKKLIKNGIIDKEGFKNFIEDFKVKEEDMKIFNELDEDDLDPKILKELKKLREKELIINSSIDKCKVKCKSSGDKEIQHKQEFDRQNDQEINEDNKRKRRKSRVEEEYPPLPKIKLKLRSDDKKRKKSK